jgi:hypothetical protein
MVEALQHMHGPTMSRAFRRRWILTIVVLALTPYACRSGQAGNDIGSGDSLLRDAERDSAYKARLAQWLRDSVLLDSMTRLVNTDSLYRLYRRALEPPGVTLALMTDVSCEEVRLKIRFGSVPAGRAIHVVQDTMYRDRGIRDGMGYFIAHAPAEGVIELSPSRCGPYPRAGPKVIGTTRLDTELAQRPRAPRTRRSP